MTSSKISIVAVFLLGVIVGILLGQNFAPKVTFAATTYELPNSLIPQSVDFPVIGSGATSTPNYSFAYRLPLGITFDRIQMSVPSSQGTYSRSIYWSFGQWSSGWEPWNNIGITVNGRFTSSLILSAVTHSKVNDGTLQWIFSTSTTITSNNRDFWFLLDPNPPAVDFSYNSISSSTAASLNGSNYPTVNSVPVIKLCNSTCDNNIFIINPVSDGYNSGIVISDPLPYGTTTASTTVKTKAYFFSENSFSTTTKAQIDIYNAVNNQLEDSVYQFVTSGHSFSFDITNYFNLATGSKKMIASFRSVGSNIDLIPPKETFFNVIDNSYLLATGLENPQSSAAELTQINCSTFDVGCQFQKAIVFLFSPSQTVLNKFGNIWTELAYLKPFGYITIAIDRLNNVNASGVGAYTMPSIPFISSIFTPLRSAMAILLWGIFAFIFYNRIKNIDI